MDRRVIGKEYIKEGGEIRLTQNILSKWIEIFAKLASYGGNVRSA